MNKIALITGITGQDGAYLAEFLLKKVIEFTGSSAARHRSILSASTTYLATSGYKTLNYFE